VKVARAKLLSLYLQKCDKIAEDFDWVTHFTATDVVFIIAQILEENPDLVSD
jgi:hypothetical protein